MRKLVFQSEHHLESSWPTRLPYCVTGWISGLGFWPFAWLLSVIASNRMFWLVENWMLFPDIPGLTVVCSLFLDEICFWNVRCFRFSIRKEGWLPYTKPLSCDMGHNIVLNMENLYPKWKVWPHAFSAVMASASHGEMLRQYCGWLVFLLFLNTNSLP